MKNKTVIDTIILSHCLRDNIEIMSERGIMKQKFKNSANNFHRELDKFLEATYKPIDGSLEFISDDIDLINRILTMSPEEKSDLKNKL